MALIPALKPFWARFTEGLADLALRMIEARAERRRPGIFGGTPPAGAGDEAPNSPQPRQVCGNCGTKPGAPAADGQTPAPGTPASGCDGADDQADTGAWRVPG